MMKAFTTLDTLQQSATLLARNYALRLVAQVGAAADELAATGEEKALHDVRVAMRRLRGWLRSYHDLLRVPDKLQRRLRKLMRTSNRERDRVAALLILAQLAKDSEPGVARTAAGLSQELAAQRASEQPAAVKKLLRAWRQLAGKLRRALRAVPVRTRHGHSFLEISRRRIAQQRQSLVQQLDQAFSSQLAADIHRARIATKRLRYLLEPFAEFMPTAGEAVAELGGLQDAAGAIQDRVVLLVLLESVYTEQESVKARLEFQHAAGSSDVIQDQRKWQPAGLLALAKQAGLQQQTRTRQFLQDYRCEPPPACITYTLRVETELQAAAKARRKPSQARRESSLTDN